MTSPTAAGKDGRGHMAYGEGDKGERKEGERWEREGRAGQTVFICGAIRRLKLKGVWGGALCVCVCHLSGDALTGAIVQQELHHVHVVLLRCHVERREAILGGEKRVRRRQPVGSAPSRSEARASPRRKCQSLATAPPLTAASRPSMTQQL